MAYTQKSDDIKNTMSNLKSSSNYGGESTNNKKEQRMDAEGTVHDKPTKPNFSNFSYNNKSYSIDAKDKSMTMPGLEGFGGSMGNKILESNKGYSKAHKSYTNAFALASADYDAKSKAYKSAISSSKVKTNPAKTFTSKSRSGIVTP
jgi:hypothetical protein